MSALFFKEMDMREPDFNLGIGGGTHGAQTGMMLIEMEKVISSIKPDYMLVYGDTNSTLAGALVAAKERIPFAHVEAGLRSYNRTMPEEVNRVLTDHMSSLLFCPTDAAVQNLNKEGITKGVHQVGDVMYDALLHNLELSRDKSHILERMDLKKGEYALATVHRAGNTDDLKAMQSILYALSALPTRVIFPVHPRTRNRITEWGFSVHSNVSLIEPLGPLDILRLQENANCILTDSGGMQKEAYLLGVRCITLRGETEWVETVSAGWNTLAGVDGEKIQNLFVTWHPKGERPLLYGDGHAAEKIRQILSAELI
jgi:UDP-N-acetylglucosamine 2-epimerase